jgi:hypothetical protein
MATAPDVSIYGKLGMIGMSTSVPSASFPEIGGLDVALCNYGSMTPRVGGEAIFARVSVSASVVVDSEGDFNVWLYSNQLIEPAGTYYTITFRDSNGDAVQTEAYIFLPGAWNLANMQPYDPGQQPPPLPPLIIPQLDIVPFNPDAVFDGTNFTAFQMTLTGDAPGPSVSNILPGNLYTFIIRQDTVGGHFFAWPTGAAPSGVKNGSPIDQTPNALTVQTFVADDTTMLYAIGPATYYSL